MNDQCSGNDGRTGIKPFAQQFIFRKPDNTHIVAAVNKSLYQTIIPSFNDIRRPTIAVNPARKTAI